MRTHFHYGRMCCSGQECLGTDSYLPLDRRLTRDNALKVVAAYRERFREIAAFWDSVALYDQPLSGRPKNPAKIVWLAPLEPKAYQVWMEGYVVQDEHVTAQCLGDATGVTFREAVVSFFTPENQKRFGTLNRDTLAVYGSRLFPSEEQARRTFG